MLDLVANGIELFLRSVLRGSRRQSIDAVDVDYCAYSCCITGPGVRALHNFKQELRGCSLRAST